VCGQGLVSAAEQRRGRHDGCPSSAGPELLAELRSWRREESGRRGVPAYAVLTDAALEALAERAPRTEQELLGVPGIGPAKLSSYGAELLEILAGSAAKD
jgi:DNA helicase-2/ATP-dependent DNA helicase PcrA